ncbi:MAG: hypothetical protein QXO82_05635 [Candidatus Methanomethylicia archaeon]
MGVENLIEAFINLIVAVILASLGISVLIQAGNIFEPLIGDYSKQIIALAISALIGAVLLAGYALKRAAKGI